MPSAKCSRLSPWGRSAAQKAAGSGSVRAKNSTRRPRRPRLARSTGRVTASVTSDDVDSFVDENAGSPRASVRKRVSLFCAAGEDGTTKPRDGPPGPRHWLGPRDRARCEEEESRAARPGTNQRGDAREQRRGPDPAAADDCRCFHVLLGGLRGRV